MKTDALDYQAKQSLDRVLPRLRKDRGMVDTTEIPRRWTDFEERLAREWGHLFRPLLTLYGDRYDFFYHLETIVQMMAQHWMDRPEELVALDAESEMDRDRLLRTSLIGGALYVDLFSENLSKLKDQIGYFKKNGITYLHLMPLFAVRPGDNDGGYAVSDYRMVNPSLGNIDELGTLAQRFREEGISLVLDFVFNHTSEDHGWAKKARSGDPEF